MSLNYPTSVHGLLSLANLGDTVELFPPDLPSPLQVTTQAMGCGTHEACRTFMALFDQPTTAVGLACPAQQLLTST
jgi:hypothetical protein